MACLPGTTCISQPSKSKIAGHGYACPSFVSRVAFLRVTCHSCGPRPTVVRAGCRASARPSTYSCTAVPLRLSVPPSPDPVFVGKFEAKFVSWNRAHTRRDERQRLRLTLHRYCTATYTSSDARNATRPAHTRQCAPRQSITANRCRDGA